MAVADVSPPSAPSVIMAGVWCAAAAASWALGWKELAVALAVVAVFFLGAFWRVEDQPVSALEDRTRWLDHLHSCWTCGGTAGYCPDGLDLLAMVEASLQPGETMPK